MRKESKFCKDKEKIYMRCLHISDQNRPITMINTNKNGKLAKANKCRINNFNMELMKG
jgi:hypothetical protein